MIKKPNNIPKIKPNPSSDEAIEQGCICPIVDNHYGEGFLINKKICYIYSVDCPIHGFMIIRQDLKKVGEE